MASDLADQLVIAIDEQLPKLEAAAATAGTPPEEVDHTRSAEDDAEAAAMLRGAVKISRSNPTLAKEIPEPPAPVSRPNE